MADKSLGKFEQVLMPVDARLADESSQNVQSTYRKPRSRAFGKGIPNQAIKGLVAVSRKSQFDTFVKFAVP